MQLKIILSFLILLSLAFLVPSDAFANDGYTIAEVESLEHDTADGTYKSLVQVDANTYALAYAGGDGGTGFISTFTISADGTGIAEVATLEHDTALGLYSSLVQVDANTYALAYAGGDGGTGFISTFTISADGTGIAEVATLEHDTANGEYNSLVQVDANTYALAYSGGDGYTGFISTFTINSAGVITPIKVANHAALGEGSSVNLEHDTANGEYNSLVQVDANTYALAYAGDGYDGFISTFTISADGTGIAEVATLEHDTALGEYNSLVQVDANTYALAYAGDENGFISTFTIA